MRRRGWRQKRGKSGWVSQLAGLTRHQLDEIAREREAQRQGAARATERADRSIEIALAHVPSAFERARGG